MGLRILAALPLALALALTGCGSDDKGGTVASANGGASQGGAKQGGEQLSPEERGVKFAQCMREHGGDMEDPTPGEGARGKV